MPDINTPFTLAIVIVVIGGLILMSAFFRSLTFFNIRAETHQTENGPDGAAATKTRTTIKNTTVAPSTVSHNATPLGIRILAVLLGTIIIAIGIWIGIKAAFPSFPGPGPSPTIIIQNSPLPSTATIDTSDPKNWWQAIKNTTPTKQWNMTLPLSDWQQNSTCKFLKDGYHVYATNENFPSLCFNTAVTGASFAYEATFNIISGDSGGVVWHAVGNPPDINAQQVRIRFGQDGTFDSYLNPGDGTHGPNPIPSGTSQLINKGHGVINTLVVIVRANQFAVFINGQWAANGSDTVTNQGLFGVQAAKYMTDTDIAYTTIAYWSL